MEEENVEVKNEAKKFDFKNFDYKKYLPYAGIALAVIVVIIVLVSVFGGGPGKAVKKYVSGMNSKNAKKVVNSMDPIGMAAWGYQFDEDDFDEDDYDDFIEAYEEAKEEYGDELEEEIDDSIDYLEDALDEINDEYKSYKMKVEEIKKTEKLGKNLYAVKAKISMKAKPVDKDEDEIDEAETMTFIVYKNKIISGGLGVGF